MFRTETDGPVLPSRTPFHGADEAPASPIPIRRAA
jgi:hypothetical protein